MGLLIKCSDIENLLIPYEVAILIVNMFSYTLWNVLFNCSFKVPKGLTYIA